MQPLLTRLNWFHGLLGLAFACQIAFWWQVREVRPDVEVVPLPPSPTAMQAIALGDEQAYFRFQALQLQNFGDTFGRFTSLRYYDMTRIYQWLTLMDTLDARSNMLPAMASYYFSQTQNTADVRYLANYIYAHASRDPAKKWWWLLQGLYLAMHKIKDMDLALKMVTPMINPAVPAWAQQMAAVVHEKRGEMEDAYSIIKHISDNATNITEADIKFMRYFIEERLKRLDQLHGTQEPAHE